jgi:hypothetical protein
MAKRRPKNEIGTPEQIKAFGRSYLRGATITELARQFQITYAIAQSWVKRCQQVWREQVADEMWLELARVDSLEAFAWEQLKKSTKPVKSTQVKKAAEEAGLPLAIVERVDKRTTGVGNAGWAGVIQWCIDYRTKVTGGYAPDRLKIDGEIRVAGQSREEFMSLIAERIKKAVESKN